MPRTEEVIPARLPEYLSDLSSRFRDRKVTVRVESLALGDQILAQGLPLIGISAEQKGSERDAIEITVGRAAGQPNLCHLIPAPRRVLLESSDDGRPHCLDVEDDAGTKTLVFFQ